MEWFFGKAVLNRLRDRFHELKDNLTTDLKVYKIFL